MRLEIYPLKSSLHIQLFDVERKNQGHKFAAPINWWQMGKGHKTQEKGCRLKPSLQCFVRPFCVQRQTKKYFISKNLWIGGQKGKWKGKSDKKNKTTCKLGKICQILDFLRGILARGGGGGVKLGFYPSKTNFYALVCVDLL